MIRFASKSKPADDRRPLHEVLGIPPSSGSKYGSTMWKGMRLCPREHRLKELGVTSSKPKSEALDLGWLFHHVLEAYYTARKDRLNHVDAMALAWQMLIPLRDAWDYQDMVALVERMLVSYFEQAATDDWEILAVEEELIYEEDTSPDSFKYSVRLDLLVECKKRGGIWIVEHKTCKRITEDMMSGYLLDMQTLGQIWTLDRVVDVAALGGDLRGCIVNITSKDAKTQHARVDVIATHAHLAEFELSMRAWTEVRKTFEHVGWPKALGSCAGISHYFSECQYFGICHGHPTLSLDNLDEHTLPLGFSLQLKVD